MNIDTLDQYYLNQLCKKIKQTNVLIQEYKHREPYQFLFLLQLQFLVLIQFQLTMTKT